MAFRLILSLGISYIKLYIFILFVFLFALFFWVFIIFLNQSMQDKDLTMLILDSHSFTLATSYFKSITHT